MQPQPSACHRATVTNTITLTNPPMSTAAQKLLEFVRDTHDGCAYTNKLQEFYASLTSAEEQQVKLCKVQGIKKGVQSFVAAFLEGSIEIERACVLVYVGCDVDEDESLEEFLIRKGVVNRKPRKLNLHDLESGLKEFKDGMGLSMTALKNEIRPLGLNLVTGRVYGSAWRLNAALQNGAPYASKNRVKEFKFLKGCLVDVLGW